MTEAKLIRIPDAFIRDHQDRELPTPRVVKSTARHNWIDAADPAVAELLNDAEHYAHPHGPDGVSLGLKASARATAKAIKEAMP